MDTADRYEREIKELFGRMFPLVPVRDLPTVPNHIPSFIEKRISQEVEWQTQHFTTQVVKVLCEVTHPKTHVADMARLVVNKVQMLDRLRSAMLAECNQYLKLHIEGKKVLPPEALEFIEKQHKRIHDTLGD